MSNALQERCARPGRWPRRSASRAAVTAAVVACAHWVLPWSAAAAQTRGDSVTSRASRGYPPGIQDNSFLIEESYNQDPGVVQHISGFQRDLRGGDFVYQFTQEWPLGGVRHQGSYSIPLVRADRATGVGDVRLNYRYQLVGDGSALFAVSPRLTAILPTGSAAQGRGAGAVGAEAWLPASLVLSPRWVAHGNLGVTVTPHARNQDGARAATTTWTAGGSAIWMARPFFNVLLETLYERAEDVAGPDAVERSSIVTVSPGVRWAYNFRSGLQIVPGVAVPLGVGPSRGERSVFLYLSFEHPFTAAARRAAAAE